MQDDVVHVNVGSEPVCDARDRPLQIGVLERHGAAAAFAHDVVVVRAVGVDELPPPLPVAEVEAVNEPGILERGERTVHACRPDRIASGAQFTGELRGRAATAGAGEAADHGAARAAGAVPPRGQFAVCQLRPCRPTLDHDRGAGGRACAVTCAAHRTSSASRKQPTSASVTAAPAAILAWYEA